MNRRDFLKLFPLVFIPPIKIEQTAVYTLKTLVSKVKVYDRPGGRNIAEISVAGTKISADAITPDGLYYHVIDTRKPGYVQASRVERVGLPPFDITSAFANVQNNGVIDIPPGQYYVTNTLSLIDKQFVTVNANNAFIIPSGDFTGKAVLDMRGAKNCNIHNLLIPSWLETNLPIASIVLGRTETSDGSNNTFLGGGVSGKVSGAGVYSVCAEGIKFYNFNFQTENESPVLINSSLDILGLGLVESSDCLMWFHDCTFRNYGTAPYLVLSKEFVSGMSIENAHVFLGNGGTFIRCEGENVMTYYLTLSGIRAEGNGNCLLIDAYGHYVAAWDIERIMWQISSEYIIHSSTPIIDSRFDFTFCNWSYAPKWLHLTNNAYIDRVDLVGQWTDKIVRES